MDKNGDSNSLWAHLFDIPSILYLSSIFFQHGKMTEIRNRKFFFFAEVLKRLFEFDLSRNYPIF
jgi:hypothetical protein